MAVLRVGHRSSGMGRLALTIKVRLKILWKIAVVIFFRIAISAAAPGGAPPRRFNYRVNQNAGMFLAGPVQVSA